MNARRLAILGTSCLLLALLAPTASARLSPAQTARVLAGRTGALGGEENWREELHRPYRAEMDERWGQWETHIGQKMGAWARGHLEPAAGETIFYPFSGPDLPTIHRLYPQAARYVFVAYERAGRLPPLDQMRRGDYWRVLHHFRDGLRVFLSRGFFVTDQMEALFLDRDSPLEGMLGPLLFFAEREGLEVTAVEPIRVKRDASDVERHPGDEAERATWDSVRLLMRRRSDGHELVLDYVRQDLRDVKLRQRRFRHVRGWLGRVAHNRVVFKAASHLVQRPEFTITRDAVARGARSVVQDESGLAFSLLDQHFDLRLFGRFRRFLKRFARGPEHALREAYRTRTDVQPLPFRYGYLKRGGDCLLHAYRRKAAP